MKKYIFSLVVLVFAGNMYAHQPDISTTLLSQQSNNQWVLQVKASLTAFKHEIRTSFPDETYTSPEEFQSLLIRHVLENVSIVFDGDLEVNLKKPYVKIGHETNVVFEAVGVPKDFNNVIFKNSSFKDINRNQSALVILKKGFSQDQFVLNDSNDHTAQLKVKDTQFVSSGIDSKSAMVKPNLFLGLVGLGIMGLLIIQKVTNNKNRIA